MPLTGSRILVCEDIFLLADDLKAMLESVGAEVVGPYSTVEAARSAVEEQHIDAAVLDIELKDGLVYPLATMLCQLGVPFLFATGYSPNDLPEEFANAVCECKPINDSRLIRHLRALLPDSDERAGVSKFH